MSTGKSISYYLSRKIQTVIENHNWFKYREPLIVECLAPTDKSKTQIELLLLLITVNLTADILTKQIGFTPKNYF